MKKILTLIFFLIIFSGCNNKKIGNKISITNSTPVTEKDNIIATNYEELTK